MIIKIKYEEKEYIFDLIVGITYYIYFDKENNTLCKSKIINYKEKLIKTIKL